MIIQKERGKVVPAGGSTREKFKMVAKTMVSLEDVLADELRALGAENVTPLNRAVEFEGDMRMLYRANYCCRTALAILKPFAEFDANDDQELYDQVYKIRWEKIMDVDGTFMIDSTTSGEVFTHSYYAALKTKDAIVDRFRRNFGKRPSIDTEEPDYKFNLHIRDNHVTLLMNSSGDSLHKRGYRQGVGIAPINEVLAAGLLKLAGWMKEGERLKVKGERYADADNTSHLSPLTSHLLPPLTVTVSSFSYKQGLPDDNSGNGGGHIFDCRALPNPGRYAEYKCYTGKDRPVIEFLEREPAVDTFLDHAKAIVAQSVDKYLERHFTHLCVSFGCTGGQHRSVYCAEQMSQWLSATYPTIIVHTIHREQKKMKNL